MATLDIPAGHIHYEVDGHGYPVLLFAPGFLSSRIERWRTNPAKPGVPQDWLDPMAELADEFQLIALDVRNAGQSRATVDRRRRLDELHRGLPRAARPPGRHASATSWARASACRSRSRSRRARPGLVTSLVLQNPIGLVAGEPCGARSRVRPVGERGAATGRTSTPRRCPRFGKRMFGGDFIFSVTREFVRNCTLPMLLMPGDDLVHPAVVSDELARAPQRRDREAVEGPRSSRRGDATRARVPAEAHAVTMTRSPSSTTGSASRARARTGGRSCCAPTSQFFERPFADEDEAARALEPFDIILATRERTPFPPSLVARLPRLRMFGLTGARAGLIDLAGMIARGVTVCYTEGGPGVSSTAELALGLMLAAARHIPRRRCRRAGRALPAGHAGRATSSPARRSASSGSAGSAARWPRTAARST